MLTEKEIIDVINELDFGFKLDPKTTPGETTLKSLGVDSLDIYNIFVDLETATGRKVPDSDIEKLTTIKELAAYFS